MPIEFRCTQCGKLLRTPDETAGKQARCPECGTTVPVPQPTAPAPAPEPAGPFAGPNPYVSPQAPHPFAQAPAPMEPSGGQSGKAIAALVLGICSVIFWCCPLLGFPVALAGLILGLMSMSSQSRGMALAGVCLSAFGLLLTIANAAIGAFMAASGQHPLFQP